MASTSTLIRALLTGDRLNFLISLNPKIADVIPRGPQHAWSRADLVSLNPQPLPPGPPEMAIGYRQTQLLAQAAAGRGEEGGRWLLSEIDDWCGTGWPKWWPKPPRPWPWPWPDSDPGSWDEESMFLGAAVASAQLAGQFQDPSMQEMLGAATDRLLDRAMGG